MRVSEQRQEIRVSVDAPAEISIGTQFTLHGRLKDLSFKSAFIVIKSSISFQVHDDIGFSFQVPGAGVIHGHGRISRVSPGEGFAIYFTKIDETSEKHLVEIVK